MVVVGSRAAVPGRTAHEARPEGALDLDSEMAEASADGGGAILVREREHSGSGAQEVG